MNAKIWPRLPRSVAETIFANEVEHGEIPSFREEHSEWHFGPTGARITSAEVETLRSAIDKCVVRSGGAIDGLRRLSDVVPPTEAQARMFDREVQSVIAGVVPMTWAEAGTPEVWSTIALLFLPEHTAWRWSNKEGTSHKERWVGTDLTRHAWSRYWWRATLFDDRTDLLDQLAESELNQLLERVHIGGNAALLRAFTARLFLALAEHDLRRRTFFRKSTRKLRRRMAFVEPLGLEEHELNEMLDGVIADAISEVQ